METETKLKFVDKQNRCVLCEGRSRGMGLALCKLEGDTLSTVGPISPCRDYLNDEVYSNHTGKPFGAYGYHAKDRGLWKAGRAYAAFCICGSGARSPSKYATMDRDLKAIDEGGENLQAFLNAFEKPFGATPTKLIKFGPNMYVADADLLWVKWTYMVSLLSILITNGLEYKGGDVIDYIKKLDGDDSYRIKEVMHKIKGIHSGNIPDDDWNKDRFWHDAGIQSFAWTKS
jgi:hypothetical protein